MGWADVQQYVEEIFEFSDILYGTRPGERMMSMALMKRTRILSCLARL